ncbi:hypothetical protein JW935_16730 [candidate division KSB1 bacterium]|nr:hypothetical protein [candidate division KSB1 bacterium]
MKIFELSRGVVSCLIFFSLVLTAFITANAGIENLDKYSVSSIGVKESLQGCQLAMASPNGGETWDEGSTQVIMWTPNDPPGNVKLSFSRDDGSTWTTIISSTPDDGRRYWTVPVVDKDENQCLFRVQNTSDTSCVDISDAPFTIKNTCAMEVIFPNGGDFLQPGTLRTILWTPIDESGEVKIDISTNGGSTWSSIEARTPDDGLYEWPVPDINSSETLVRVTSLSQLRCSDISDANFIIGQCTSPSLQATDIKGVNAEALTVEVLIHKNNKPLHSFGFELAFNPEHLIFDSIQKGTLTGDWIQVDGAESSTGVVRVGGYHSQPIPAGSDGCIAKVLFRVGCSGCTTRDQSSLSFIKLLDDIAGMNVCGGFFEYDTECTLGDVNMDGNITPADALCAFQLYLNGSEPAEGSGCDSECAQKSADVTCDGLTTPQDARDIFQAYVTGIAPQCPENVSKQNTYARELVFAEITTQPGRRLRIPVRLDNTNGLDAFGFDVRYPAGLMSFSGLEPGTITAEWEMLDARTTKGFVRIGGYTLGEKFKKQSDDFLTLLFNVTPNATGSARLEIERLFDDLAAAHVKEGYVNIDAGGRLAENFDLAQNFPNPFNMSTELVFDLPTDGHVLLVVHDIAGRVVKELVNEQKQAGTHHIVWEGIGNSGIEMASGVYFAVLHSAGRCKRVKMVLIK